MVAEVVQLKEQNKQIAEMHQVFEDQKFAFSRNPMPTFKAVSYTHLTLPTICSV